MALTKVTGSVIKDSVSLSGNVSIGGTLTYEDVTNIDSLGIITARTGVDVSGGQLDVGSNVKIGNSGVATATNFKTGSSNLHSTGLTVGNNFLHSTGINVGTGATIHVPATNVITFGTSDSERLRITSGGDFGIGTNNPQSRLEVKDNSSNNYGTTIRLSQGYNSVFSEIASNFGGSMTLNAGQGGGTPVMHFQVNDSEKMRLDNNGKLLKGHTADIGQIRTQFNQDNQFVGSNNAGIRIGSYSNNAYASSLEFVKSRSATLGTNTLVQNGDTLGQIFWGAADGSNYQPAAYILASIEGAPNTNDVPTRLSFGTAKDGAAGAGEKMRINPAGQIMIGDSTVGNSTTEKLILQGQIGNDNYEASIGLRRGSTIGTGDAGLGYIKFQDSAGSTGASMGGRADSGWSGSSRPTHLLFQTVKSGSTSLTEACRITSDGYLQQHKLIAVSYSDSRAISLTNVDLTPSNFYNATFFASDTSILDSNGHFVAPVHGVYRLYFRCTTDSNSGNRANVRLRKNGNTINEAYDSASTSGHYNSVSSEIILPLNAGEYLDIQVAELHAQSGTQHKVVNFHMLG